MIQFVFGFQVLAEDLQFTPSVSIPGLVEAVGGDGVGPASPVKTIDGSFASLKGYISGIYRFGMAITGILAVIVLALGGITWLTSGGNANSIAKAKQYIWGSITGLVLALLSYTILNMVNPDIVKLTTTEKITQLSAIATEGCLWMQTECDLRFQKEQTKTECGAKPLLNNKPDGSYIHCCCGSATKDPIFVKGSAKCVEALGDKAFISSFMPVGMESNDSILESDCQDECADRGNIMNYRKISEKSSELGCCVCNFDVSEVSGTVTCATDGNCEYLNGGGIDYTCWPDKKGYSGGTCKPCKKSGTNCGGWFSYDYECCPVSKGKSGDCILKMGGSDVCK